jgi:ankyrin repeat protein
MSSASEKLCHAAASGDVPEIERQIAGGADPNAFEGTTSATPLRWAANGGHVAAIAALVKAGARVDGRDSAGYTPLMVAAYYVHTAAVDALLAAGADVHRVNYDGDTALHLVLTFGHLSAARVLLEAGARTDVCNKEGNRPIDVVRCAARSLVAAA